MQEIETDVVVKEKPTEMEIWNPTAVLEQVKLIQDLMKSVMKVNEHFGIIPGTNKPTLLKPGAEKLGLTFRLEPQYTIERIKLEDDHIEYIVTCDLRHINTGQRWGSGVGSCSTKESKYRWRKSERLCPVCNSPAIIQGKKEFGGGYVCWKKKGGCGEGFAINDVDIISQEVGKKENEDIADQYNTVLKMAKKRAHVDAMLTATAASDIFTQDLEELKNKTNNIKTKSSDDPSDDPSEFNHDSSPYPEEEETFEVNSDIIEDSINKIKEADTMPLLTKIWNDYPTLQKNERFKKAFYDYKAAIK